MCLYSCHKQGECTSLLHASMHNCVACHVLLLHHAWAQLPAPLCSKIIVKFHQCPHAGRVEVSANKREGDVGTKRMEGEAIKETAKINSENTQAQVLTAPSNISVTHIALPSVCYGKQCMARCPPDFGGRLFCMLAREKS